MPNYVFLAKNYCLHLNLKSNFNWKLQYYAENAIKIVSY